MQNSIDRCVNILLAHHVMGTWLVFFTKATCLYIYLLAVTGLQIYWGGRGGRTEISTVLHQLFK